MGRSVRSGLEILSSLSVPAPAHHSAQTLSSVYPWSYYITSGSIAPTFLCGIALDTPVTQDYILSQVLKETQKLDLEEQKYVLQVIRGLNKLKHPKSV